jgi:hypothetical protein
MIENETENEGGLQRFLHEPTKVHSISNFQHPVIYYFPLAFQVSWSTMIWTLVDIGAELVMVISMVLLDWLTYVDNLSLVAPPLISSDGCLGSGNKLKLSKLKRATTSDMVGRSTESS